MSIYKNILFTFRGVAQSVYLVSGGIIVIGIIASVKKIYGWYKRSSLQSLLLEETVKFYGNYLNKFANISDWRNKNDDISLSMHLNLYRNQFEMDFNNQKNRITNSDLSLQAKQALLSLIQQQCRDFNNKMVTIHHILDD